jgi:cysteine dioxygenase
MGFLLETGPSPETIATLAELLQVLALETRAAGYTDAMLRYDPSPDELAPLATWDHRHYTRQCIQSTSTHELLLICYEPGQRTSIHDYDSQMAWIKPVTGHLREERFKPGPDGGVVLRGAKILVPGNLSYLSAGNPIHRHSNISPGRAMTLNLYARPIRRWRVYDERTGQASLSGLGGGLE